MKKVRKLVGSTINRYPIFIFVILLTFLFREWYPFSFYPMYNEFPNWSYSFYLVDENQNHIYKSHLNHGNLSHIFYAEANNLKMHYGNNIEKKEDMQKVGEKIIDNIFANKDINKDDENYKEIRLVRIYNYFQNDKLISDTLIIAKKHVQ